jgi:hypothetical protein
MSVIAFSVRARVDLGGANELVPVIDGRELTDMIHAFERDNRMEERPVSYGGLIPSFFKFGPLGRHFLGLWEFAEPRRKVPLLGCNCGEWGCWPLMARITVRDESVVWNEFEQPYRKERDYSGFGPFTFDVAQYQKALAAVRDLG